jgi:hypothetical protein
VQLKDFELKDHEPNFVKNACAGLIEVFISLLPFLYPRIYRHTAHPKKICWKDAGNGLLKLNVAVM